MTKSKCECGLTMVEPAAPANFGATLRRMRLKAGKSMGELARHLHVRVVYISAIEREAFGPVLPDSDFIKRAADFLELNDGDRSLLSSFLPDEMAAKRRAEQVAAMPHVKRWIKRFLAVAKDMPPEVWVFCGNGADVLALDELGCRYDNGGGVDGNASVAHTLDGRWDGGDY